MRTLEHIIILWVTMDAFRKTRNTFGVSVINGGNNFWGQPKNLFKNGAEFKLTRRGTILSFSLSDLVIASTGWVVV